MRLLCGHGLLITVCKSNCTTVMFSQACVIPSVHRVGGCIPACKGWGMCVSQHTIGQGGVCLGVCLVRGVSGQGCVWPGMSAQEGVCQGGVSTTPQRWPLKRAVHILLEYIRVLANSCKSKKSNGASIG